MLFESQFLKLEGRMKQAEKYSGGGLQMAGKEKKNVFYAVKNSNVIKGCSSEILWPSIQSLRYVVQLEKI